MLKFTGERIVPEADNCEPLFASKMYQEHAARYWFASQACRAKTVLDIGCGVGYGAQLLALAGAERVTAFDVSPEAVGHAGVHYQHPRVQFLVANAISFSFSTRFDVVTCFELIEHVEKQHDVLKHIASALTEDGLLFISTPRPLGSKRSQFHEREMSPGDFERLLRCYFDHVAFFVENNHFASLITAQEPRVLEHIRFLHEQFSPGQADYIVAVAGRSAFDANRFQPLVVINNDAYVTNLERDVEILHRAEDDLKAKLHQADEAASEMRTAAQQREKDSESRVAEAQAAVDRLRENNESLRSRIAALDELVAFKERQADTARDELTATTQALAETSSRIEQDSAAAAQLRTEHAATLARAAELEVELSRARISLKELRENNNQLRAGAEEQTRRAEADLANARKEWEQLEHRASAAENWCSSLRQEVAIWNVRATEERNAHQALRERLRDVYQSKSWRITAPLRWCLDVLLYVRNGQWTGSAGNRLIDAALPPFAPPQTAAARSPVLSESSDSESQSIPPASSPPAATSSPAVVLTKNEFARNGQYDVVYVIGCHEGESKRYRTYNFAEGLAQAGWASRVIGDNQIAGFIDSESSCHTLVLFRCAWDDRIERIISYCRSRSIPVVFDVDDLIFEEESIRFVRVLSTFSPADVENYRSGVARYRRTLLESDYVTCTTQFLADRIREAGKPARVIPNSLNGRQIEVADAIRHSVRGGSVVRIAYFSGSNTHQVDFESCEGALLSIMEKYPQCRFVLVGILDLHSEWDRFADRVERHPFLPYIEMLTRLAEADINLAPLEAGNPYCEGKSQLKIFEAGLVAVPTVASDVSSYREAIQTGVDGFLASSDEEWLHSLDLLVSSPDLRERMGVKARERALRQFGIDQVAAGAAAVYGLPQRPSEQQERNAVRTESNGPRLKISWIIPGLIIGGGGHRNILRAAYHLQRFGHELELYFTNTDMDESQLLAAVNEHFYPIQCRMHPYRGSINPADVLFATHWSTVDAALRARNTVAEIMYFVQDFEPAFAPMGTEYILAENTYRQGLYCITSGPWCEVLLKRDFGCDADHFVLPVDRHIYKPRSRTKQNTNILFFAKPEMPRRCFELGVMALEQVHHRRPDVEIILFGSRNVETRPLPFPATIRSLLPGIEDLAEMYCNADIGVVFSTTNPSLVPYEMMACGLPVVDLGRPGNETNFGGRLDIALLADPQPPVMAAQICELLESAAERAERSANGLKFVGTFPSEEQMARRVEELILNRVSARSTGLTMRAGNAN